MSVLPIKGAEGALSKDAEGGGILAALELLVYNIPCLLTKYHILIVDAI